MKILRTVLEENMVFDVTEDICVILVRTVLERKSDIKIKLLSQGVKVRVIYADSLKDSRIDLSILVNHIAPNTKSEVFTRTVLRENTEFSFCGNIILESEAGLSLGSLEAKSLADGKNISWEARPNLIIKNKTASALHKESLVNYNQDQVFYLENRGFSQVEAKKALKKAFLSEAIEKTPNIEEQKNLWKLLKLDI